MLIAIISDTEFSPKVVIAGFPTIKKGITLTQDIAGVAFAGTASSANSLAGVDPNNFYLKTGGDIVGQVRITNDLGLVVGADSDFSIQVDNTGNISFTNTTNNADIAFIVKDGNAVTTVMTIDGGTSRIGIGTATPTTKLDVVGTVNATAFTGPITGVITTSLVEINNSGSVTFNGTVEDANVTNLVAQEPTGVNTITLPNRSGTVLLSGDVNGAASISGNMFKSKINLQIRNSAGALLTQIFAPGTDT